MASIIKTDNIQKVSDDSNIIKKCGSTITIGSSGASVALASGATQTGFGRTGTVDWCTTAKTSPFTAVSGDGFFVNTTSGAITVTLPSSPSAGDIVALKDYANTWDTNNVTLCNNGSKINGICNEAVLSTESQSVTLIYVDSTKGWQDIHDSTSDVTGVPAFIVATGGTETTCGNFKIHTFTSDGTFTVNTAPTPANNTVDYLVVAGGGGALKQGGGAGGFRLSNDLCMPAPLTSPLANPTGITVTTTSFPITVGGGGAGQGGVPYPCATQGNSGSNSIFSTITSAGGGGGDNGAPNPAPPKNGGSGGGGSGHPSTPGNGGLGNQPPVSPPQGNNGGASSNPGVNSVGGGGGGGAGAAGSNGTSGTPGGRGTSGAGGVGSFVAPVMAGTNGTTGPVCGTRYFAGGGGGASQDGCEPTTANGGAGGAGGGGTGLASGPNNGATPLTASNADATANTGGGGGGYRTDSPNGISGSGGSGIVIIRYKFQ